MATKAVATRDHEEIRRWAEEHGGIPAKVKGTGGLLRIDFIMGPQSGGRESSLEEIPWNDWLRIFDEQSLVFLHGTGDSRFFKLVYPDTLEQKQRRKSAVRGRGSSRASPGRGGQRSSGSRSAQASSSARTARSSSGSANRSSRKQSNARQLP